MAIEPDEPRAKPVAPRDLGPLSIEELGAYIAVLEAEIARAKAMILAKKSHRSGAEGLFRR